MPCQSDYPVDKKQACEARPGRKSLAIASDLSRAPSYTYNLWGKVKEPRWRYKLEGQIRFKYGSIKLEKPAGARFGTFHNTLNNMD